MQSAFVPSETACLVSSLDNEKFTVAIDTLRQNLKNYEKILVAIVVGSCEVTQVLFRW